MSGVSEYCCMKVLGDIGDTRSGSTEVINLHTLVVMVSVLILALFVTVSPWESWVRD